jgi:hypothetical protein
MCQTIGSAALAALLTLSTPLADGAYGSFHDLRRYFCNQNMFTSFILTSIMTCNTGVHYSSRYQLTCTPHHARRTWQLASLKTVTYVLRNLQYHRRAMLMQLAHCNSCYCCTQRTQSNDSLQHQYGCSLTVVVSLYQCIYMGAASQAPQRQLHTGCWELGLRQMATCSCMLGAHACLLMSY